MMNNYFFFLRFLWGQIGTEMLLGTLYKRRLKDIVDNILYVIAESRDFFTPWFPQRLSRSVRPSFLSTSSSSFRRDLAYKKKRIVSSTFNPLYLIFFLFLLNSADSRMPLGAKHRINARGFCVFSFFFDHQKKKFDFFFPSNRRKKMNYQFNRPVLLFFEHFYSRLLFVIGV